MIKSIRLLYLSRFINEMIEQNDDDDLNLEKVKKKFLYFYHKIKIIIESKRSM